MYRSIIASFVFLLASYSTSDALTLATSGTLTENQIITSKLLGYDLQYRVYLPDGYEKMDDLAVLYVTDGQWYISEGDAPSVLDELIVSGKIDPVIAVFVDNRNPDNLDENRRNRQFFCNRKYADFFADELIPAIDEKYPSKTDRTARVILGLSFGGLNSACFGLQAYETFEGIAMQSPAMHPVRDLFSQYEESDTLPIKLFLSTGSENDNQERTRRFKSILESKGYPMHYVEVPYGHNWTNWKPLIDDVLLFYFQKD
jgi:enterochelin esterase-like enzyme